MEPMTGYHSKTQEKNLAWLLPRPKPNHYIGGMPLYCEEWLIELAEEILEQQSLRLLNLFCGCNKYGTRADIKREVNPDVVCDAGDLPFKSSIFDVVLADPPYSGQLARRLYGTKLPRYKKWGQEGTRVLRDGGLLIVYHVVLVPNPSPTVLSVVKRVFIGGRPNHRPRVAVYFRKAEIPRAGDDRQAERTGQEVLKI